MTSSDPLADDVDFAVAAYLDEGRWELAELAPDLVEDIDDFLDALRRLPSQSGALGLVSVNDEFFVIVRVSGVQERLLLSDVSVVDDWPLAAGVADYLDVPDPDDDDLGQPAGDLSLLADLGVSAIDLAVMLDDPERYPDEILKTVARRLGFGTAFEAIVG